MNVCSSARVSRLISRHLTRMHRRCQSSWDESKTGFVDFRRVVAEGGKGGDGSIHFLRLWRNDRAGPSGGDGGNGGHVLFRATESVSSLVRVPKKVRAKDGEDGRPKDCDGKSAEHAVVDVPLGTLIKASPSGELLADLSEEDSVYVAARGGCGGRGNHFFATDTNQSPMIAQRGALGEVREYGVEMRVVADVGLIGFPNAGKSTLLRALSRARPKVAGYPFTTLRPHIGVIQFEDYVQLRVADIPGLIEEAHKNRGLGYGFLRHVERCACMLYVLDLNLGVTNLGTPQEQLETLQEELRHYNPNLLERPFAVAANKIDLPGARSLLESFTSKVPFQVFPISALNAENIAPLISYLRKMYDANQEKLRKKSEDDPIVIENV